MNVHLERAYALGVKQALEQELTKEGGFARGISGIPRAVKGGLWGAGLGGAHGALTGEGEADTLSGAFTGGLMGAGVGYGSRHLSKGMKGLTKATPGKLWAGRATPEAREVALKQTGKAYEKLLQNPAERASLGKSLSSMGLLGLGGGIAAAPIQKRMSEGSTDPTYDQLYKYYLQSAQRGMR